MAVVDQLHTIEFYVEDAKKQHSTLTFWVGSVGSGELPLSILIDTAIALKGYVQPLISGHIRRANLRHDLLNEIAGTPANDSNINAGVILVLSDGGAYRELLFLPARNDAIIAQTWDYVPPGTLDYVHPDVASLNLMLTTGFELAGETWVICDTKGDPLNGGISSGAVCYAGVRSRRRR